MSARGGAGSRLIVALDTDAAAVAAGWAAAVAPHAGMLKVGLEFFLAHGAAGLRAVAEAGRAFGTLREGLPYGAGGASVRSEGLTK